MYYNLLGISMTYTSYYLVDIKITYYMLTIYYRIYLYFYNNNTYVMYSITHCCGGHNS